MKRKMNSLLFSALFLITTQFSTFAKNVYLNQVGYFPKSPKLVYTSQKSDAFYIINYYTGEKEFQGKFIFWKAGDQESGMSLYRGDFSEFSKEGKFFIITSTMDSSAIFSISDSVNIKPLMMIIKGFYLQRCGMELLPEFAGNFAHKLCHKKDGDFHLSAGFRGYKENIGGWHNSGNYGKYIINGSVAAGTLLLAYEFFPDVLGFDNNLIPESGNRIPDLLDEVRYELTWMMKMQDTSGGVFFKLTKERFAPFVLPENDIEIRYIYGISSNSTADFAAVMAKAGRIFQKFDKAFSEKCIFSAEKAWEFLELHPEVLPQGGFQNPFLTNTTEYRDSIDIDERLWASAELYITTGNEKYNKYFLTHIKDPGDLNFHVSENPWQNVRNFAFINYLFGKRQNMDVKLCEKLTVSLTKYCEILLNHLKNDGFQSVLLPSEYTWGSNGRILFKTIPLIVLYLLNNKQAYEYAALKQLDYIFGANPLDISFVTGIGSNYPVRIHHNLSAADSNSEPVPGLLVNGPNSHLDDIILGSLFNSSSPPAVCYADYQDSYSSNENDIGSSAALVFLIAFANSLYMVK